jgi:surface protein
MSANNNPIFQPADKAALESAVSLWEYDNATALATYGEINTWDTSLITDMSDLFDGQVSFNDDIGNWDTSAVTNMNAMFFAANSFNQNISSWDVAAVTSFSSMFSGDPMAILDIAGGAANRLAIHAAWSGNSNWAAAGYSWGPPVVLTSSLGPTSLDFAADGATNVKLSASANVLTLNDGGASVRLANLALPTTQTDAASKAYVDGAMQGLSIKAAVRAASAVAEDSIPVAPADLFASFAATGVPAQTIALFASVMVDGESIALGDRVLLKGQLDPNANGIYEMRDAMSEVLFPGTTFPVLVRTDDMLAGTTAGSVFTFVQQGTENVDTGWVCTNDALNDFVGANELYFEQFSSEGHVSAGTNLEKSGTTLHVADSPVFSGTITTSASVRATTGEIEGASLIAGGLTLSGAVIEHDSGTIPFGANNLTTTGEVAGASLVAGGLSLSGAVIEHDSGTIPFGPNNLTTTGTVSAAMLTATSDARLKTDVTDITDALGVVLRLRGVRFEWKDSDQAARYGAQVGFLAQEVQEVVPQVVRVAEGTGVMSVAYAHLVPLLVAAIQELSASVRLSRQGE